MLSRPRRVTAFSALTVVALFVTGCEDNDDDQSVMPPERSVPLTDDVAASIALISIETLQIAEDLPHSTHTLLEDLAAPGPLIVSVLFRTKPSDFAISLSPEGETRERALTIDPRSLDDEHYFIAEFETPSSPWSYTLSGISASGSAFSVAAQVQVR